MPAPCYRTYSSCVVAWSSGVCVWRVLPSEEMYCLGTCVWIMMYESTINTIRSIGLTDTTVAANKSTRDEKQHDQLNRRLWETCFLASSCSAGGRPVHNRDALGPAVLCARPHGPCAPCILVTARPPRAPVENTCTAKKRFEESGARVPLGAQCTCAP